MPKPKSTKIFVSKDPQSLLELLPNIQWANMFAELACLTLDKFPKLIMLGRSLKNSFSAGLLEQSLRRHMSIEHWCFIEHKALELYYRFYAALYC